MDIVNIIIIRLVDVVNIIFPLVFYNRIFNPNKKSRAYARQGLIDLVTLARYLVTYLSFYIN
ncbi:hypothetical protein EDO6_01474 [Paenibacillus xylanexedens]|nr:hypothetical protein EDO6_01474 [Paenibacillus xylanexedens]